MIYNPYTGLGYDAASQSEYIYAEPIAAQEVYDCYLGSRLFARIVDTPAQHLAAAGFGLSLDGDANAEKTSQSFDEYCKRIGTKGVMFQALSSARLWGGAGVILWIDDGRPMDEPVDLGAIRSIQAATFASRWELIPVEWGTSPLDERGKLNQPVMYRYTPRMRSAGRGLSLAGGEQAARAWHDYLSHGRKVHASRVLGFTGVKIPSAASGIAGAYLSDTILSSGWEGDTVYRALRRRIKDVSQTFEACAEFIRTVSSLVLQSPEVRDVIEAYGDDTSGSALKLKIDSLRQRMGAFGMTALAPDENVIEVSRTAQGIQSLLDFVMVGLSADCHPPIPITFLFGLQPPGGLNGAGDADIQNYYRALDELRDQQYVSELRWLAKLILLAKDGPTRGVLPAVWDVQPGEFVSVSEAERIELELKRAQLLKEYVDLRAIAPEEIRADLKGQNNPLIQLSDEYDEILKTPSPGGDDAGAPPDMGGMAALQAHAENAPQPAQAAPEADEKPEAAHEQAPAPAAAPAGTEAQTRTDEEDMKPIQLRNGQLVVPVTDILAAGPRYAPLAVEALRQARLDAAETRFVTMKHHLEGEAGRVIPIGVETKEGGGETWKMPSGKAVERTPEQAKASRAKAAMIARKIAKTSKHPAVIAEHEARAKALEGADKPKVARKPKAVTAKPPPVKEAEPEAPPAIEASAPQHPAFKAASAATVPEWKGRKLAETYALSHFRGHELTPADMQHAMSNLAANAKPEDRDGDYPDVARALREFNAGDRSPVLVDMLKRAGVDTDVKFHVPDKKSKHAEMVRMAGVMSSGGVGLFSEMQFNGKSIDPNEIANRIEAAHGEINQKQAFDHAHELFSAMQAHNRGYAGESQKKVLRTYGLDPETLMKAPESKPAEPADPASEPENVDPKHAAISQALSKHASGYRQPGAFKVNADVSPTVEHVLSRVKHSIANDDSSVGVSGVYHDVDANGNHVAVTTDGNRLTMAPVSKSAFAGEPGTLYARDGKTLEEADFPNYKPLVDSIVRGKHQPINASIALNAANAMMQANRTIHGTKGITAAVLKNENGNLVMSYNVNGKRTSVPIGWHSFTLGDHQMFVNPMYIHEALSSVNKSPSAAMEFPDDPTKPMAIHTGDGSIHLIGQMIKEQGNYSPKNVEPKKAYQGVAKVPEGLQGAEAAEYQRVADTASLYDPARAKFESKPVESSSVEHALKRIKHTISKDDQRYGLTEFMHHIDRNGNHVDVSTDGHRLTIVPSSSDIKSGVYSREGKEVAENNFPDYEQILEKIKYAPNPAHAIDVSTLRSAADAMTKAHSVFYDGSSYKKASRMKLINVGDSLVARKDLLGHVVDVPIGRANPTIPRNGVSFHSRYIFDAMKAIGKNGATIQHTGDALSPVVIHGSDGSKHVIMPFREE